MLSRKKKSSNFYLYIYLIIFYKHLYQDVTCIISIIKNTFVIKMKGLEIELYKKLQFKNN